MVDGLKLYEDLLDRTEVSKLVSLVNDLRVAGKRGQFQGKCTVCLMSVCWKDLSLLLFITFFDQYAIVSVCPYSQSWWFQLEMTLYWYIFFSFIIVVE